MKVFLQSPGETLRLRLETLPVLLMNHQGSREQKVEPGSGKHSVHTHFPKDPNCDFCLKKKITRASCRRRAGTVVPRAGHFGDMIRADHKILSEESESRNNLRYAEVVQDLAAQWLAREVGSPRHVRNRRRRTREGPEPACVQIPWCWGGTRRGEGRINDPAVEPSSRC